MNKKVPVSLSRQCTTLPSEHSNTKQEIEEVGLPRLTDWKIEMNPRQEYTDAIRSQPSTLSQSIP